MRKIVLEFASREEFEQVYLYDLPGGGVFVHTIDEFVLGELVLLLVFFPEIPDGLMLHGRVVWRRPPTKWRSALQPGVGIRLDEADPDKLAFLVKFCEGRLQDRRGKSRRIPVKFRVDFATESNWYRGVALNISREGLFVSTDADIHVGEMLVLKLYLKAKEPPDQCYGRVVRYNRSAKVPGIGVELEYKTPIRRRSVYTFIEQEEAKLLEK